MHIVSGNVYAVPTSITVEPVEEVEPVAVEPVEVVAPEPEVITQAVTETFEASAYIAMCDTGCSGITATGLDVRSTIHHKGYRVVATDPEVIPMGTVVRITLSNGHTFEAIAADTGGAINGRDIDLLVTTVSEAMEFGRQRVEVEIVNDK